MLNGIDVSSWQGSAPDYSGFDVVFIKVTEGYSYVSPVWEAQYNKAINEGKRVGFYHYPHPAQDVTREIGHFLDTIRDKVSPGIVLCLDWEWYGQTVTNDQARNYKDSFLAGIKAGFSNNMDITYVDRNNWLNVDANSNCGDGLWIADYVLAGQPRIQHSWVGHQYTSSPVDKSVWNFNSLDEWDKWTGKSITVTNPTNDPNPITLNTLVNRADGRQGAVNDILGYTDMRLEGFLGMKDGSQAQTYFPQVNLTQNAIDAIAAAVAKAMKG